MPTEQINERTLFLSFYRICLKKEKKIQELAWLVPLRNGCTYEAIRNCVVNEWEVADGLKIMQLRDTKTLFRSANEEQAVKTLPGGRRWVVIANRMRNLIESLDVNGEVYEKDEEEVKGAIVVFSQLRKGMRERLERGIDEEEVREAVASDGFTLAYFQQCWG
ncbi:hypothetical protein H5410_000059 [Solanum commersonii]|uniref:Uncharacterized protein n=1 Tax=Solanum commersonii TaxID=4109 RepID=A0A9J6AUY0_SOLCO|nr:hypothetical protein H5410_000059 [Solanum commersonii]